MSTYAKRVSTVWNIEALAGTSLDHKSLAIKSTLLFIFYLIANRGSQLELVAAFEGVGIPLVIEQSSYSSA